jgi:flavin-dependent dehydrogenase
LAAALTVARAGGRAVVHELRSDVGARFHGDLQGIENWTTDGDVLEELAQAGIEPTFEVRAVREGLFFGPDGREYRYRSAAPAFYLVRRGRQPGTLDSGLKEQAVAAGVEIRFRQMLDRLPEGGIVAGGPRGADVIAVGYVFETRSADGIFGVLSDRLAPKGYSYLLLSGGRGTIAACLFDDFHAERLYLERTVEFFRGKVGFSMENARRFGGAGNVHLPETARNGGILFTGEAAGFQDALWGFGIRLAMLSGHFAARALLEGRPESYDRLWRERLGGVLRASIVNRFGFQRMGDRGYASLLRGIARSPDLRQWLRGRYAFPFWKTLAFPIARRFVRSRRGSPVGPVDGCDCTWCRGHAREPGAGSREPEAGEARGAGPIRT